MQKADLFLSHKKIRMKFNFKLISKYFFKNQSATINPLSFFKIFEGNKNVSYYYSIFCLDKIFSGLLGVNNHQKNIKYINTNYF